MLFSSKKTKKNLKNEIFFFEKCKNDATIRKKKEKMKKPRPESGRGGKTRKWLQSGRLGEREHVEADPVVMDAADRAGDHPHGQLCGGGDAKGVHMAAVGVQLSIADGGVNVQVHFSVLQQ